MGFDKLNVDAPSQNSSAVVDLAVIILNYKTPELVVDCLRSLDGQILAASQEVVVVDNCSGDKSADEIELAIEANGWSNWARVVRSPVNGGFAAGNNVGIKASDAKVYLLLNSDTIVRDRAIEIMMQTLEEHPEIDMLGPQLEWLDGEYQTSTFRYRTPITEMLYASNLGIFWKLFSGHVVARKQHGFENHIDWVCYACVAIRREVFDKAGLLDEGYFMYFEDMAHCRQATQAGFSIAYQPDAHVVHLQGGTSSVPQQTQQRKQRPAYYYAARAHYFYAFYGKTGYLVANFLWTLGWCVGLLRGRTGAVQKEPGDIWSSPKHTVKVRHD